MRAMSSIIRHGLGHLSNHQGTGTCVMLCGFARGGGEKVGLVGFGF